MTPPLYDNWRAVQDGGGSPDREIRGLVTEFLPGLQLDGGIVLGGKLGEGGMGEVFEATNSQGMALVVKAPKRAFWPSEAFIERFRAEATLQRDIVHPFIVRTIQVGSVLGEVRNVAVEIPYLVLERVEGKALTVFVENESHWLTIGHVMTLFERLADALDFLHARGFVHKDVKPGNVMVGRGATGSEFDPIVKLLDFGLVMRDVFPETFEPSLERLTGEHQAPSDPMIGAGSPMFMAPEIWEGRVLTPASDVYALAISLYIALTGSYPYFTSKLVDWSECHQRKLPSKPSDVLPPLGVHAGIDEAILAGLLKEPTFRPASASHYIGRVREAMRAAGIESKILGVLQRNVIAEEPTRPAPPPQALANAYMSSAEDDDGPEEPTMPRTIWTKDELDRIGRNAIFQWMAKAEILAVLHAGWVESYPAGETLFDQGDPGDFLLAILEGEVDLFQTQTDGSMKSIRRIGEGDLLGELGLLLARPRSASAKAVTAVRALKIDRDRLDLLLNKPSRHSVALLLNISRNLARTVLTADERARAKAAEMPAS